jgi:ABC-2 type transport system ATP-binding protein
MDAVNPFHRTPAFLQDIVLVPEEISLPAVKPFQFENIYAPFYPRFNPSQFRELLGKFEVDEHQNLSKMSHGQRKKALISFALSCNTKFLFLDEPTNGLDIPSKGIFRSLLASAFSEEKIFILSTHQVRDLQSLIDSVIILENHKIALQQSLDHIARKFSFGHSLLSPTPGEIIFKANTELGQTTMGINTQGESGSVDLETLFNASIEIPEKLSLHLNN